MSKIKCGKCFQPKISSNEQYYTERNGYLGISRKQIEFRVLKFDNTNYNNLVSRTKCSNNFNLKTYDKSFVNNIVSNNLLMFEDLNKRNYSSLNPINFKANLKNVRKFQQIFTVDKYSNEKSCNQNLKQIDKKDSDDMKNSTKFNPCEFFPCTPNIITVQVVEIVNGSNKTIQIARSSENILNQSDKNPNAGSTSGNGNSFESDDSTSQKHSIILNKHAIKSQETNHPATFQQKDEIYRFDNKNQDLSKQSITTATYKNQTLMIPGIFPAQTSTSSQLIQILNNSTAKIGSSTISTSFINTTTSAPNSKYSMNLTTSSSNSKNNFSNPGMVQFICKSDGKKIHLTPIREQQTIGIEKQSPTSSPQIVINNNQNMISIVSKRGNEAVLPKGRIIKNDLSQVNSNFEQNYAKFIQSSPQSTFLSKTVTTTSIATTLNKQTLPKFNQAFGKAVFQPVSFSTIGTSNIEKPSTINLQKNMLYARPCTIANNNLVLTTLRNNPTNNVRIISSMPEMNDSLITPLRISFPFISRPNNGSAVTVKPQIFINQMNNRSQNFLITTPRLNIASTEHTISNPVNMENNTIILTSQQIPQQNEPTTVNKSNENIKIENVDTLEQLDDPQIILQKSEEVNFNKESPSTTSTASDKFEDVISISSLAGNSTPITSAAQTPIYCQTGMSSPALSVTSQTSSSSGMKSIPNSPQKSQGSAKLKSPLYSTITQNIKSTPRMQEDEQTTQRIYDILAEYAEQIRNSPDLNNRPAPRRRALITSSAISSKRKKTGNGSNSELSQEKTELSEDDSCGMGSSIGIPSVSSINTSPHGGSDENNEISFNNFYDELNKCETPLVAAESTETKIPVANQLIFKNNSNFQTFESKNSVIKEKDEELTMGKNTYILPMNILKRDQQLAILSSNINGQKILAIPGNQLKTPITPLIYLNQCRSEVQENQNEDKKTTYFCANMEASSPFIRCIPQSTLVSQNIKESSNETNNISVLEKFKLTNGILSKIDMTEIDEKVLKDCPSQTSDSPFLTVTNDDDRVLEFSSEESKDLDEDKRKYVRKIKRKKYTKRNFNSNERKHGLTNKELRLQKSLSEECEDLGVEIGNVSDLFPEAELFDSAGFDNLEGTSNETIDDLA